MIGGTSDIEIIGSSPHRDYRKKEETKACLAFSFRQFWNRGWTLMWPVRPKTQFANPMRRAIFHAYQVQATGLRMP